MCVYMAIFMSVMGDEQNTGYSSSPKTVISILFFVLFFTLLTLVYLYLTFLQWYSSWPPVCRCDSKDHHSTTVNVLLNRHHVSEVSFSKTLHNQGTLCIWTCGWRMIYHLEINEVSGYNYNHPACVRDMTQRVKPAKPGQQTTSLKTSN